LLPSTSTTEIVPEIVPETVSPPPLPCWHEHDRSSHVVQFYANEDFFLDALARFVGTALGGGDAAIVVATKAHRNGLLEKLAARGLDVTAATQQGRYIALDAAETLAKIMRDGVPAAEPFVRVIGGVIAQAHAAAGDRDARIAVFGEMVALLWAEGKFDAAIQLEQLWNHLAQTHLFSLRCAYPMNGFNRDEHTEPFLKVCEQHSAVIPGESYTSLVSDQDRLRNITELQQKAVALETEKAERKGALQLLQEREARLRLANLELELEAKQRTELRRISATILSLQDAERRRIARELHDSLGQYLVSLKLNLDLLFRSPQRGDLWSQSQKLMEQCISEVRTLSHLLHPPMIEEAGLSCAARWFVEGFGERSGIAVTLHIPDDWARLPQVLEIALFRVLQEALTNVHRHAGTKNVEVRFVQNTGRVTLQVKDGGKGISQEVLSRFNETGTGMGVGLAGMRERIRELGGEFQLESGAGGTLLKVAIPHEPAPVSNS
jgi:signal transduction histidine kinase